MWRKEKQMNLRQFLVSQIDDINFASCITFSMKALHETPSCEKYLLASKLYFKP